VGENEERRCGMHINTHPEEEKLLGRTRRRRGEVIKS